jgi:hypothetical protein
MHRIVRLAGIALLFAVAAPHQVHGAFHLMQIEQVVGGVCGDTTAQAVQLRMRAAGQNLISGHSLTAYDAAGANPVVLVAFASNVAVSTAGSRILVTSPGFQAAHGGPTPDFVMTNLIPASSLEAGKVTFEAPTYWSLAWGGSNYTGTNSGATDNDADGNFNPPFPGVLAWTTDQAVQFQGAANAQSTTNAADYALSASPVTLTNNAGASAAVSGCVFGDGFETGGLEGWSATVP